MNDPLFSLMVASSFSVHGASRHHCLHLEDARGFVPLFTVCPISFLSAQRATHLKLCDGATAGDALGTEKLWAGAVLLQLDELCQEVAKVVGAAVVVCEGLEGIRRGEGAGAECLHTHTHTHTHTHHHHHTHRTHTKHHTYPSHTHTHNTPANVVHAGDGQPEVADHVLAELELQRQRL